MSNITFADVLHQAISFSKQDPAQALVLELIDHPWVQRLRDISQTANTRLVYMYAEHSRFGHSLGVAYLACVLMHKLAQMYPQEVEPYRQAISAAALLHDVGHLAPGSHMAYRTWFPDQPDNHEVVATRIIQEDPDLSALLRRYGTDLAQRISAILMESPDLPPWTWQIISGGGWNVDRGNWCAVDSILAGVSYGTYNIPALIESVVITPDKQLALKENRLDSMMHFAVSRHAMYRQIYQHRVILAADMLNQSLAKRARDLGSKLEYADDMMREVLAAKSPLQLKLGTIFKMRECWWRYHIVRWSESQDKILADLSQRILNRRLFKTIRLQSSENAADLRQACEAAVKEAGLDPHYYLHEVSTKDVNAADYKQSLAVLMDDNSVRHLSQADPLFNAMAKASSSVTRSWFALPPEAKILVGRER